MDMARVWPLTGRETELDGLRETLVSPPPGGAVVAGDAGVGKTRLLREALAGSGASFEWVVATRAAASIPLAAVLSLLGDDVRPSRSPLALLTGLAKRFEGRAPTIIAVDDAHLLDEASAAVLHQLAVRGLIVTAVTTRTGEPCCDALAAIWKEPTVRVSLPPLSAPAIDRLLDVAVGRIDSISRRRIHRLAGGNPLLLKELLADARDSGCLVERDGVWRWKAPAFTGPRLEQLIDARIATLDLDTQRVLETIACGEPVRLSALGRLAPAATIEAAERSGIAVCDVTGADAVMRLAHPLYTEVLRARLPASRARNIYAELASTVEETAGPDDVLLAGFWEVSSGTLKNPQMVMAAARQAASRFDLDLAERLARAVCETATTWEARVLLARILGYQGRGREAVEVLPPAPSIDSELWAPWVILLANLTYWSLNQPEEADRILGAAPPGTPELDLIMADRSWIQYFDGRIEAALATAREVLAHKDVCDQAVVWATMSGAAAAGLTGRLTLARQIVKQGRAVLPRCATTLPWAETQVGLGHCHALRVSGRLREAQRVAERYHRLALARDAGAMAGLWAGMRGIIARAQGRPRRAQTLLLEAISLLDDGDEYFQIPICCAEMAGACATRGDVAGAREWMGRADTMNSGCNRVYDPWIELSRAWILRAEGLAAQAIGHARHAARLAREREQPAFEAVAWYDVARLGQARAALVPLRELAEVLEGEFAKVMLSAAHALVADDGPTLQRAAKGFVQFGWSLHAAETASAAAQAFQRHEQMARALSAWEARAIYLADCDDAITPMLDGEALMTGVTAREREIARLAVALSSKEVAARLGLSVHTVNNTLARAFTKLGVSTRGELAALIGGQLTDGS